MRTLIALLFAALFTLSITAKEGLPAKPVCARRLTILSANLPAVERASLLHKLQGRCYASIDEVRDRLHMGLQDFGYFQAVVGSPIISVLGEENGNEVVALKLPVNRGAKYRIHDINFRNMTVFPNTRLRAMFPKDGELFNRTKFGRGLDNLERLYESKGFVNFTVVPDVSVDTSAAELSFTIDVTEGKPYYFGLLILDGLEPRAGVGKELLQSWETLKGNRYSSMALQQWIEFAIKRRWSDAKASMEIAHDYESQLVNVKISFP